MADNKRLDDKGILTESGTNEFEMLSFVIDGCTYGVNVSKVREIIKYTKITPLPGSDERILGLTMPRDEIITVVDLRYCLTQKKTEKNESNYFIICHFNKISTAFQVDDIKDIKRFGWNEIISPNNVINTENSMITGIIKTEDDIISVLDFELIMTNIDINNGLTVKDLEKIPETKVEDTKKKNLHIVLAEDSKMLNKLIVDSVEKVGYHVTTFYNGEDALKYVEKNLDKIDCLISDIEMPVRDGLSYLKEIKSNEKTTNLPFIIFSSLIDEPMQRKCMSLGADATLTKPELGNLIEMIDSLVAGIMPRQKISKGY